MARNLTWFSAPMLALSTLLILPLSITRVGETGARYRTGEEGTAAVRVASASFAVSDPVLKSPDEILDCNLASDEIVYELEVRNRSEVDMRFTVTADGAGDGIVTEIRPATGELESNIGSATVCVRLTVADPDRRDMEEWMDRLTVTVAGEQIGGDE